MRRIDVNDCRRTAKSVLTVELHEVPDVISELAKAKRLSTVMRNLNRLMDSPAYRQLGRRAVLILAFSTTDPVLNRGHPFGPEAEMQSG